MTDNNIEKQKQSGKGTGTKSRTMIKDTMARMLLEDDGKKLRKLCEKFYYFIEHDAITAPDFLMFFKFLNERLEGRATQQIELSDAVESLPSASMFKIVKVEPTKDE